MEICIQGYVKFKIYISILLCFSWKSNNTVLTAVYCPGQSTHAHKESCKFKHTIAIYTLLVVY